MLNVCFSENALDTLRQAVQAGYLIQSETVCIPDDLSLGDISNPKNIETRRSVLKALYGDAAETSCRKNYSDFFQQIYSHDSVLIWYADTPAEYCGLLYTLWLLRETRVKVGVICCSRTLKRGENQYVSYYSTGELAPEEVIRFLPFETELSKEQTEEYVSEWDKLADENGVLRVCWNNTVQSADISYYDDLLLKYISKEPQTVGEAVGRFVFGERLGVNISFVLSRLKALVKNGTLYAEGENIGHRDIITLLRPRPEKRILNIEAQIDRQQVEAK